MKVYLIKSSDALLLNGLSGLHQGSNNNNYTSILVNDDNSNLNNLSRQLSSLPKNCDPRLVCSLLKKMQSGLASFESIQQLKRYLQCAEKKDNEGDSDFIKGVEKFFWGLLNVIGAAAGFLVMTLLIGTFPAYAAWISLLIIPIVAVATYGILKSLIGAFQCLYEGFSYYFCPKATDSNTERLQILQRSLSRSLQSSSLPIPHEQADLDLPPAYDQAVARSDYDGKPLYMPLQQVFAAGYTPNFYRVHNASDDNLNEELPPAYRYCQ